MLGLQTAGVWRPNPGGLLRYQPNVDATSHINGITPSRPQPAPRP